MQNAFAKFANAFYTRAERVRNANALYLVADPYCTDIFRVTSLADYNSASKKKTIIGIIYSMLLDTYFVLSQLNPKNYNRNNRGMTWCSASIRNVYHSSTSLLSGESQSELGLYGHHHTTYKHTCLNCTILYKFCSTYRKHRLLHSLQYSQQTLSCV